MFDDEAEEQEREAGPEKEKPAGLMGLTEIDPSLAKGRGRSEPARVHEDEDSLLELLDSADSADNLGSLSVPVLPKRQDEFVCRSCFLVKHRSQLVDSGRQVCLDCAA